MIRAMRASMLRSGYSNLQAHDQTACASTIDSHALPKLSGLEARINEKVPATVTVTVTVMVTVMVTVTES